MIQHGGAGVDCLFREGLMRRFITAYLVALVTMIALDALWLGVAANRLYRDAIGPLLAEPPDLVAAGLFYLVYPLGVVIFAVAPALARGSGRRALVLGGLFGFFNYATYNLTNLAILKFWPASPLAFDLPWGTGLTAVAAWAAYRIARLA